MKKKLPTVLAVSSLLTLVWAQESAIETDTDVREPVATTDTGITSIDDDVKTEKQFVPYRGVLDSAEVVSAEVFNMQEEEIGNIDRLLINSESGSVEHAVVSVGGFLGIGDRLVAVPWSSFEVKQEMKATTTRTEDKEEADAEESDSERLAASDGDAAEKAEEAADEPLVENDLREDEAREEVYAAPSLHIYLDADQTRLSEAPEFDPDKPNQLGSSEYWGKDWDNTKTGNMKKDPRTTSTDTPAAGRKLSSTD